MKLSFPLYVPWERTKPSVRAPVREMIDGQHCLVVFTSKAAEFRYNFATGRDGEKDQTEPYSAEAFLRWIPFQYPMVVLDPHSPEQRTIAMEELLQVIKADYL